MVFKIMGLLLRKSLWLEKDHGKVSSSENKRRSRQQGSLKRTDCFLRRWEKIKDHGLWAPSTCCVGRATRSPSTERATWPPETTSISEPSGHPASLYCCTPPRPQSRVRAGSQIPGHRVFLHLLVENNRGVKGAACLLEARWDQGMVDRSSLRSRECRLARS